MKVTVCFAAVRVIVPCGDGRLAVSELIERAVTRYKKAVAKGSDEWLHVKCLQTEDDGAILDPDDLVCDVADDKDKLIAVYDEDPFSLTEQQRAITASMSSLGVGSPAPESTNHQQYETQNTTSRSSESPLNDHSEVGVDELRDDVGPIITPGSSAFQRAGVRQSTMQPSGMLIDKWNNEVENGQNSQASSVEQTSVIPDIDDPTPESHIVEIRRLGESFGIQVQGYTSKSDGSDVGVFVCRLDETQFEFLGQKWLNVADRVLIVNGRNVAEMENGMALAMFHEASRYSQMKLVVSRMGVRGSSEIRDLSLSKSASPKDPVVVMEPSLTNTRELGKLMTVQLEKGARGLGFSITSRDTNTGSLDQRPIYIKSIIPGGAAFVDGRLLAGDRLLEVNGVKMTGKSQSEAVKVLRGTSGVVRLLVSRQDATMEVRKPETDESDPKLSGKQHNGKQTIHLRLSLNDTGSAGLGISVKGKTSTHSSAHNRNDSSMDMGIFVKTVMPGGAAYKDGRLLPNDQIVAINGDVLDNKSNANAMECLRAAMLSNPPTNVIDLLVRRRPDSKNSVLRPLGVRRQSEGSGQESAIDVGCDADHESDTATSPESTSTSTLRQRRKSLPSSGRPQSAGMIRGNFDKSSRNRHSMMAVHERSRSDDFTKGQSESPSKGSSPRFPPSPLALRSRQPSQKSPKSTHQTPVSKNSSNESTNVSSPSETLNSSPTRNRCAVSMSSINIEVGDKHASPSGSKTSLTSANRSPLILPARQHDNHQPVSSPKREDRSKSTTPSLSSSMTSSPARKRTGNAAVLVSNNENVEPTFKKPEILIERESVAEEEGVRDGSLDTTARDSPFQRDAVGRLSMSERRKTALDPSSSKVYQERQQKMAVRSSGRSSHSHSSSGRSSGHSSGRGSGRLQHLKSDMGIRHVPSTDSGRSTESAEGRMVRSTSEEALSAGNKERGIEVQIDLKTKTLPRPRSTSSSKSDTEASSSRTKKKRDCNESFRRAVDHSFDQSKLSNMSEVLQESVLTMRNDIGTPSKVLPQDQFIGDRIAELPEEVRSSPRTPPRAPQRHAPPARPIIPGSPHMDTPARRKKKKKRLFGGLFKFGRSSKSHNRDKHREISPAQSLPEDAMAAASRARSGSFDSRDAHSEIGDHKNYKKAVLKRSATSEYNLKSRSYDSEEEEEDNVQDTGSAGTPSGTALAHRHSMAVLQDLEDHDVTESETVQV